MIAQRTPGNSSELQQPGEAQSVPGCGPAPAPAGILSFPAVMCGKGGWLQAWRVRAGLLWCSLT